MASGWGVFVIPFRCGDKAVVPNLKERVAEQTARALQDAFDQGRKGAFKELRDLIGAGTMR